MRSLVALELCLVQHDVLQVGTHLDDFGCIVLD
jgi:hypothetical protein